MGNLWLFIHSLFLKRNHRQISLKPIILNLKFDNFILHSQSIEIKQIRSTSHIVNRINLRCSITTAYENSPSPISCKLQSDRKCKPSCGRHTRCQSYQHEARTYCLLSIPMEMQPPDANRGVPIHQQYIQTGYVAHF